MYVKPPPTATSTSQITAIYMPETNMVATLYIYAMYGISFKGINGEGICIYALYMKLPASPK